MNTMMLKSVPAAVAILLLLLPGGGLPAAGLELEPARVGWSAVRMAGSRLFLSVDAEVSLLARPASEIRADLLAAPDCNGIRPGAEVMQTTYRTRAAGRRSEIILISDLLTGAAVQRFQDDYQGRLRQRTYRFSETGAVLRTLWPADSSEERLPASEWTDMETGFRGYPPEAAGQLIADPTGIFYLISAGPLARPGDRMEFMVYSRRSLHRVSVLVDRVEDIRADFERRSADGSSRQRGNVSALRLLIQGETIGEEDDDDEFELLGLRGNLELYLDQASRAPLQLSGNVRILGRVTLRAQTVTVD